MCVQQGLQQCDAIVGLVTVVGISTASDGHHLQKKIAPGGAPARRLGSMTQEDGQGLHPCQLAYLRACLSGSRTRLSGSRMARVYK